MRQRCARLAGAGLVALCAVAWSSTSAGAKVPTNACALLKRAEIAQLLEHEVVKSFRQDDKKLHAARCAWQTEYFQTPGFETAGEPFGLSVDTQAKSTAKATIKELRASSPGFSRSPLSIQPLDGIGDEAWMSAGEVYVLKGDTLFVVRVSNYDTGVAPYPDVDTIAQQAALLVVERL